MTQLDDIFVGREKRGTTTLLPDPPQEELWCPIISVDDHVLEPVNLFEGRVASRLADKMPHFLIADDGVPFWEIEGVRAFYTTADGAAGRPKNEWGQAGTGAPQRHEDFRQGVVDSRARIGDMDLTGVWAQLGFPSIPWGFAGSRFARMADQEAGLVALRAYNDWMIDEWCAADRDRFIPCQLTWLSDPEVAAAEVRRNSERGFRCVSFSENPEALGFGSIYHDHWDPFFAACEETDTVVNLHVGSSGQVTRPSLDSTPEVVSALFPLNGFIAVVDWIFAKIPIRFPGLKVALSEAGASWAPVAAERLRRAYRGLEVTRHWRPTDPPPVELLRSFWFTSIEDPLAFRLLDMIGEDKVMVETDYPHHDTTWPGCQAMIRGEMSELTPAQVQRVCFRNAASLYRHPEPPSEWIARSVVGQAIVKEQTNS
jgi:predicted TIM-barrel fold metal-dependent hydrolase